MEKLCSKCRISKPLTLEFFRANPKMKLGFDSWCRKCQSTAVCAKAKSRIANGGVCKPTEGFKFCPKCEQDKSVKEFPASKGNSSGLYAYCFECTKDKNREKNFGISREKYQELLNKQNNVCAICKLPESAKHQSGTTLSLAVDHCHQTGKIRGLLCCNCNRKYGWFEMNSVNVIKYLESYNLAK